MLIIVVISPVKKLTIQCDMAIELVTSTERTEVLILAGNIDETIPVITNSLGRDDRSSFAIKRGNNLDGLQVEVSASCSVTWQNELFFYGGSNDVQGILKLVDCELTGYGKLTFNFYDGVRA